jgi:DNA-binding transcriptional ArsR family regulator
LEETAITRKPAAERKRPADEAVAYAVGNGTRIDALAILAEGKHSPSEIAEILEVDTSLVGNHIRELYECGCIESAGTTKVRNATQHFYRALAIPFVSDEAYQAMPLEARREVIGVLVQAIVAEAMASFRSGKMEADDDVWLLWDCVSLDARGRRELADEFQATYDRILKIKKKSTARLAKAGGRGITTLVSLLGFERSRPGRPEKRYADPADAD